MMLFSQLHFGAFSPYLMYRLSIFYVLAITSARTSVTHVFNHFDSKFMTSLIHSLVQESDDQNLKTCITFSINGQLT